MLAMYTRRLALPGRSFLLLGPRGTGKTTWLRERLARARWANLLLARELPRLRGARSRAERIDLLEAYVETYLAQEIRAEALVRSLDSFTRFLEAAALANGQVTNVAGLARDAAVARPTVQGYFEVLTDTLIGAWLPAWRARESEGRRPPGALSV